MIMEGINLLGNYLLVENIPVDTIQKKKDSKLIVPSEKKIDPSDILKTYDEHPVKGKVVCLGEKYSGFLKVGDIVSVKIQAYFDVYVYNGKKYGRLMESDILTVEGRK